jgi:hypothetical protein
MFRFVRALPWFRLLAIAKIALSARRHLRNLTPAERRRMAALARRGRSLAPAERDELRALVTKLDARAFTASAVDAFAPWPIGRFARGRSRR